MVCVVRRLRFRGSTMSPSASTAEGSASAVSASSSWWSSNVYTDRMTPLTAVSPPISLLTFSSHMKYDMKHIWGRERDKPRNHLVVLPSLSRPNHKCRSQSIPSLPSEIEFPRFDPRYAAALTAICANIIDANAKDTTIASTPITQSIS